ncbi:MAG: chromosomal replication initiator protein DnaA [Firmicutes bacterium]|uniref:Chromosomal replication initiator protein DnaA n=1 Tax=Candidatus Gallilactobacillus intestinavium TaxID=2840838 RepID=A0A9D9E5R9_9LACO|nr:chromosomal replication initiator protein DnaA [Candidatus Gallilactobacillus intestinavium]
MLDKDSIWKTIKEDLQDSLDNVSFNTWVKDTVPLAYQQPYLHLQVPSELHKDYWENILAPKVIELVFSKQKIDLVPKISVIGSDINSQKTIEKKAKSIQVIKNNTSLNDKYTFDSFVVGKNNQLANAAALAVSDAPGRLYNPLFIYGGVGLGKTHLMEAIGNAMSKKNQNVVIKYVPSETFTNDFVKAIQNNTQEEFRNKYRNVDLLLVDDIQFFADKEGTQEEFFHTFNALYDSEKQIVLTSDKLPSEIPKLQERLVSRFQWGLSVDIEAPDLETRLAILKRKAESNHIDISENCLNIIATKISSNVRELEGALSRVQAFAQLKKQQITEDLVNESLKNLNLSSKPKVTINVIQKKVAKYFNIDIEDLKGKKRSKEIVIPRQIAMFLARELTNASLPKIGKSFGGKDHTTVLHACDKISKQIDINYQINEDIKKLKEEIANI